jgi:hypothetical protein
MATTTEQSVRRFHLLNPVLYYRSEFYLRYETRGKYDL